MKQNMTYDEMVQPDRVHRNLYTDKEIFNEEMIKIFGGTWVYLAHESEIPNLNDYKTSYLGKRPVIIVRDNKNEIRALFNRCTHRGATICRTEHGNSKGFTCPYHGWSFKNNGKLTGLPWPSGYSKEMDRSELNLHQIKIDTYRGFIFGTLNQDAPELRKHLGVAADLMDQWLDRYDGKNIVVRNANRMSYNGNWKLTYDNGADGYHVSFSHRSLLAVGGRLGENKDMTYFSKNPDEGEMYIQYLGNGHTFVDQRPNYKEDGDYWNQQRPQPGREAMEQSIREQYGEEADRLLDQAIGGQMNLCIFPNLLLIGNQIQVIQPIDVDRTELVWYSTQVEGLPEEINTLRLRSQEDFPSFGEPDDMANFEECYYGLTIPEVEWVNISRGYGIEGRQTVDPSGVVTGPVTDELPMRHYFARWKELMNSSPQLKAIVK